MVVLVTYTMHVNPVGWMYPFTASDEDTMVGTYGDAGTFQFFVEDGRHFGLWHRDGGYVFSCH